MASPLSPRTETIARFFPTISKSCVSTMLKKVEQTKSSIYNSTPNGPYEKAAITVYHAIKSRLSTLNASSDEDEVAETIHQLDRYETKVSKFLSLALPETILQSPSDASAPDLHVHLGFAGRDNVGPLLIQGKGRESLGGQEKQYIPAIAADGSSKVACLFSRYPSKAKAVAELIAHLDQEVKALIHLNENAPDCHVPTYFGRHYETNGQTLYLENIGPDLIMEMASNRLFQRRENRDRLALLCLWYGLDTLRALEDNEILHLDLKPENFLARKCECKAQRCRHAMKIKELVLGDFGLSTFLKGNQCAKGLYRGTWGYMAPEIICNQEASYCSDLFSLGATLYFIRYDTNITYKYDNPDDVNADPTAEQIRGFCVSLMRDLENYYCKGARLEPDQLDEFDRLILQMLSFNPDDRSNAEDIFTKLPRKLMGLLQAAWPRIRRANLEVPSTDDLSSLRTRSAVNFGWLEMPPIDHETVRGRRSLDGF